MAKADNYYYSMLNSKGKSVYQRMYKGISSLQPSFAVPRRENAELLTAFTFMRLDHPEIIAADRYSYKYYSDSNFLQLSPSYMFDKDKLKMHTAAIQARIAKLIRPYEKASDTEKEKFIHDFICGNVKYDALKKQYSHEIIGPLGNGVGVCEGIAKTVKALCDAMGIWCIVILSHNNHDKGIKYRHAWNVIKINGKYYHFDATFDNTLSKDGIVRYDYYNLCDTQIFRDHEKLIYPAPECSDNSAFYYLTEKLSFTKYENIASRVSQNAKKSKTFVFHWRGGYMTKAVLSDLLEIIKKESEKKSKQPVISVNWRQRVIKVGFADIENKETEIEMEDANEGEKYNGEDSQWII